MFNAHVRYKIVLDPQYCELLFQIISRHDVGAGIDSWRPIGSYPLYSMLDLILKDSSDYGDEYLSENISRELIDCLKLILKQGDLLTSFSEVHIKQPLGYFVCTTVLCYSLKALATITIKTF